ncbi:MAG: TIGR04086 family membrane protein [Firmicutes bacterium]|nr:TIGR04086 family membrane protein [Bacillota bacterium]
MPEEKNLLSKYSVNPVFLGFLVAVGFGLTGTLLLTLIFYFSPLSENYLQPAGTTLYLTGAFLGGFLAAKKAGGKGLLNGTLVGVFYFLFFTLLVLLAARTPFSLLNLSLKALYTLTVSAAGGIIGIALTD